LKNRPTILPASLLASPDPKAPFAKLDAWENLSARLEKRQVIIPIEVSKEVMKKRENYLKATVFVIVNINAIAVAEPWVSIYPSPWSNVYNIPTITSQMTPISLKIANIASPTHNAGTAYMVSQKKRLSVALMVRVSGEDDSKTQWLSPVSMLTSFHQRRPTKRRPAMFLR
jgi:hypothetical protein